MFDSSFGMATLGICALVAVPLVRRIKRCIEECRKEKQAELLRQYPELLDIVSSQPARDTNY